MKRNIIYLAGIIMMMLVIASCKKEDSATGTKAVFSYVADGYKVNFTNFSRDATEYLWDFNDGSGLTSSSKAPQHIFKAKGEYLVSLTAKKGDITSTFIDTVSVLGPNITINGDFTDWEYVDYIHTNTPDAGNTILGVKSFASPTHINFYLEGTTGMNLEIIDLYLDADNNSGTGFSTWQYPMGSGGDFLFEGSLIAGTGDLFAHSGPPAGFTFSSIASFGEVINTSTLKTSGGKNMIEFSIKRDKLGSGKGFINFALIEMTSGWAQVGSIPVNITPESKFAKIPL